jgi:transcriptional regulator with XRE-family HTH domain
LVPPLPPVAARLARRLRFPLTAQGTAEPASRTPLELDPLQEAGRQLRLAREARGIGLRQLAQETRISTAVLEALERGWRDRLPEPTYLRTMLPLLERHLAMPAGSLQPVVPRNSRRLHEGPGGEGRLRRFTPGSIDVFTSWQGTLLYALLTLGLIHLLNLQQFQLASRGLQSTRPLPALKDSAAAAAASARADADLLEAFPDLRPIRQAASGQGLRLLRKEARSSGPDLSLGILNLRTTTPTRVEIRSDRGGTTTLSAVEGELALPVLPPFRLTLSPEPQGAAVRWREAVLAPLSGAGGTYAVPAPQAQAPAGEGRSPAASPP